MRKAIALLAYVLIAYTTIAQQKDELLVRSVLEQQTQCWNKGDINGFMEGYWKNDSLMFIGKSGATYGWQNTLNSYTIGYPDTASMGKLHFNLLKVEVVSKQDCFVVGKWFLTRSKGNLSGAFTLWFKKIKGRWVIVTDHSS
ncbi:MAG: YybH family protein [Ferruginibacter sp.]